MRPTKIKPKRLEPGQLQVEAARRVQIPRARSLERGDGHVLPKSEELERPAVAIGVADHVWNIGELICS
jgi:hypothetical protein